ncbi:MAG: stage II sporulation protein M [Alphaproteobacteria bacterium]|nr:stage II sporulation protein M [Alphaproteobacteria bacterium]
MPARQAATVPLREEFREIEDVGARQGSRPALVLRSAEFRRQREKGWQELEEMVTVAEKGGIGRLSTTELARLPLLYRGALSSLSVARAIALDLNLLRYLENLALRGYLAVYGPRVGVLESLGAFLRQGFPRAVRNARWHMLAATMMIVVGVVAGYMLVDGNEDWFDTLAGGMGQGRGPSSTAADLRAVLFAPPEGFTESFVAFGNYLFNHNARIGIMAFGLGLFLGLPSLLLMAEQGLLLGAFLALHAHRGLLFDFVGWVSIHGVTEFLAIILCGGAGLVIAEKVLFPGPLSRTDSLALHAREAASIAGGAVLVFLVAGVIEGGLRQLVGSTEGRLAFAAVSAVFWLTYFLSGRRSADAA